MIASVNGVGLLIAVLVLVTIVGVDTLWRKWDTRRRARRQVTVQGWQQILAWMYP